jgi:hypothetical protein
MRFLALIFALFLSNLSAQSDVTIISSPKSAYVFAGEMFETEITLVSTTIDLKDYTTQLAVDGKVIQLQDGKYLYKTLGTPNVSTKEYVVTVFLEHKKGKSNIEAKRTFSYTVGFRCMAVLPDKMNVFYIGVDNPLFVSVAGAASSDVKVSLDGDGTIEATGRGKFNVRVTQPGDVKITVSGLGMSQSFTFRCKRIPDPVPALGARFKSGVMTAAEFKDQKGIAAISENFDFEAKCDMVGFEIVRITKDGTRTTVRNSGGKYSTEEATALVNKAVAGDIYLFTNIKSQCGDGIGRSLNSLVFEIK